MTNGKCDAALTTFLCEAEALTDDQIDLFKPQSTRWPSFRSVQASSPLQPWTDDGFRGVVPRHPVPITGHVNHRM